MVVDERGVFRDDNFNKAVAVLTETDPSGKGAGGMGLGRGWQEGDQMGGCGWLVYRNELFALGGPVSRCARQGAKTASSCTCAGSGKGAKGGGGGAGGGGGGGGANGVAPAGSAESGKSDIFKLVRMIMERNYDPVIVFSFSKVRERGSARMDQMVAENAGAFLLAQACSRLT